MILRAGIDASHVLVGALDEAVLYVARADDPAAARTEVRAVLHRLVDVITEA